MSADLFLEDDDLVKLTGRRFKSKQIAWLRQVGIPFWVSATGHPVVARAAIEGRANAEPASPASSWTPRVLQLESTPDKPEGGRDNVPES